MRRWLKAGALEDGVHQPSEEGTPQGGSISVLLSNVYLHYVLDLWFERVVKPRLKGEAYMVRYLDDFVVCFQYRADALRVQGVLRKRLAKFNLTLEPNKRNWSSSAGSPQGTHRNEGEDDRRRSTSSASPCTAPGIGAGDTKWGFGLRSPGSAAP